MYSFKPDAPISKPLPTSLYPVPHFSLGIYRLSTSKTPHKTNNWEPGTHYFLLRKDENLRRDQGVTK